MIPVLALVAAANIAEIVSPDGEVRCYEDTIPEGKAVPAVCFTVISGNPENYLEAAPTMDRVFVQIVTYAMTKAAANSISMKVRTAIANNGLNCVTGFTPGDFEPETKRFATGFEADFWISSE